MKMPVKFRRGKRGFNLGKAQQIPKVDLEGKRQKKIWTINISFGIYNKASRVFKWLEEKLDLLYGLC